MGRHLNFCFQAFIHTILMPPDDTVPIFYHTYHCLTYCKSLWVFLVGLTFYRGAHVDRRDRKFFIISISEVVLQPQSPTAYGLQFVRGDYMFYDRDASLTFTQKALEGALSKKQSNFPRNNTKCRENEILHEIFRIVSRFPRYILCYDLENRLPLGQCGRVEGGRGGSQFVALLRMGGLTKMM